MTSFEENMADWPAQRDQRLELGDQLDRSRELDHFFFFKRKAAGAAAAEALRSSGFEVSVRPGLLRTSLQATRHDALTDADVARFTAEVVAIAHANNGLYDGFGGTVVPQPE